MKANLLKPEEMHNVAFLILLTPVEKERYLNASKKLNTPMAAIIRRAVSEYLDRIGA